MLGRNYDLLEALPNVYVEISSSIIRLRKESQKVVSTLRGFGIDRVLFGSDWPVVQPSETLLLLGQYGFTSEEIQVIRAGNANRLFGKPNVRPRAWRTL